MAPDVCFAAHESISSHNGDPHEAEHPVDQSASTPDQGHPIRMPSLDNSATVWTERPANHLQDFCSPKIFQIPTFLKSSRVCALPALGRRREFTPRGYLRSSCRREGHDRYGICMSVGFSNNINDLHIRVACMLRWRCIDDLNNETRCMTLWTGAMLLIRFVK